MLHGYVCRVPTSFIPSNSLIFPWFPKSFPWFFLSFHQDILVKKTYLFFLNVALVTLVYANIAISWQLLRFNSLKKHFPQIYRFKRFENGLEKKFPDLKFFSLILAENPCFSLISLTGKSLQIFPWIPWSVGTLCMVLQISTKKSKVMINLQWKYSSGFKIISMTPKGKADKIFRMKLLIGYIHIHPDFTRTKTKGIFAFSFLDKAHTLTFNLLPLNYING